MRKPLRVLILEDRESDARLMIAELQAAGIDSDCVREETESGFLARLDPSLDVILSDFSLPQFDALKALRWCRDRCPEVPFILVSGSIGEDTAVAAMRAGASDYLLKDRLGRLGQAVEQAIQRRAQRAEQRRAEEQLRLQATALASAANGIVITDRDGKILSVNPAFTAMTGYTAEEVVGQNPRVLKSSHQNPEVYRDLWRTILAGRVWRGELLNRRKDGSTYVEEQTITPLPDNRGEVAHFVAVKQDVTERKEAQEALRERTRLATLSAEVGLALNGGGTLRGMLQSCAEAMVRNLDAAFARIWTLSPTEDVLELQASAGMYTHLDGSHSRVPMGKLKIGLIAQEREPHLTNDVFNDPRVGDREWARQEGLVSFAGYPMLLGGRTIGVMAMFARQPLNTIVLQALGAVADQIALGVVNRRLAAERDTLLQRLEHVVASSPAILYTLEPGGSFLVATWVSENVRDLMGYSPAEVLGEAWYFAHLHPEDRERVTLEMRQQLFRTDRLVQEYRFQHRDTNFRWLQDEKRVVQRDASANPIQVIGSWSDITERKLLEDQFRQAQKMEAVGRLAGGVAHDFNNLLTVINGYSELLLGQLRPADPLHSFVDQIKQAGERASRLTRQLLAFSRKQVLQPTSLDLNALLNEMEKMLQRLIGEDIDLLVQPHRPLWPIKADPGQIEQVVMNLVVNARDAMLGGGKLTLSTSNVELDATYAGQHPEVRPGDYVLLSVSDTGCGMDAATRARIFEPFFSTKGEKGTGLGLATVYGIVKQSGGTVNVYSEPGIGTSFKVYLPRQRDVQTGAKSLPPMKSPVRGSETVVLAEDEDGVRSLAKFVLEMNGYTVLEAENGGEALLQCERHPGKVDLLLSDVVMPQMSGPQLAERLRMVQPNMKVLFLSGYTDDAIIHHGVLTKGTPFLQKPFSPQNLARKVREVLDTDR